MRRLVSICLLTALLFCSPSIGKDQLRYLSPRAVDLTAILPRPPMPGTEAEAKDVDAVISAQQEASAERRAEAVLDDPVSIQRFMGGILGKDLAVAGVPKTFALLRHVAAEGNALSEEAKQNWGRLRPFAVDDRIVSLVGRPTNASYPSGHTIFAYEMAVLLGVMMPEKRDALFARAAEYAQSRIIVGVHFPSDIAAGRTAGTAIALLLLNGEPFRAEFAAAQAELRNDLDRSVVSQVPNR